MEGLGVAFFESGDVKAGIFEEEEILVLTSGKDVKGHTLKQTTKQLGHFLAAWHR